MDINRDQRRHVVHILRDLLGTLRDRKIGLLGLAFKPNTDDMREAASLDIAHILLGEGAEVVAYDPVSMPVAARMMPNLTLAKNPYELAAGCDALVLVTEWNEFKHLDLARLRSVMKTPVCVDGRNVYEPEVMREAGFIYRGIGRGYGEKAGAKVNEHGPATSAAPAGSATNGKTVSDADGVVVEGSTT
jgi:UDPglucose 6-dehydrogenase